MQIFYSSQKLGRQACNRKSYDVLIQAKQSNGTISNRIFVIIVE